MIEQGTLLAGYRIDEVLGKGGMGVVYKATQLSLERTVALKILSEAFSADEIFRKRFRREGLLQATMEHPNIVTVYEAGESEYGLWLAMRLIIGPNLKDLILSRKLDPKLAVRLLTQVADALEAAHGSGLVHRDIKPHNILIGARNHAYLADFGLTKALGDAGLTRTGQFVGTLDYISPEQIRGEPPSIKSDIYSLAAVFYECLTGVVPYPKESDAAVLYAHLSDPPPSVTDHRPELPEALGNVIHRAMAKDPSDRHASAIELMQEAQEALDTVSVSLAPPAPIDSPEEVGLRDPATPPDLSALRKGVAPGHPSPSTVVRPAQPPIPTPSLVSLDESVISLEPVANEAAPVETEAPSGVIQPPDAESPPDETIPPSESQSPDAEGPPDETIPPSESQPPDAESPPDETIAPPSESQPPTIRSSPSTTVLRKRAPVPQPPHEPARATAAGPTLARPEGALVTGVKERFQPKDESLAIEAPPTRRPVVFTAAAILLVVGLAALGYRLGASSSDEDGQRLTGRNVALREVSAGPISLQVPDDWRSAEAEEIPGLDFQDALSLESPEGSSGLIAGQVETAGPTLLPLSLLRKIDGELEGEPVSLGDAQGYRYSDVQVSGFDPALGLYVVPTSEGVTTLACYSPGAAGGATCDAAAATLQLRGVTSFALGPSEDYAKAFNGAIRTLSRDKTTALKRLRTGESPSQQARAAADLARAYRAAAKGLASVQVTPETGGTNDAFVSALRRTAGAYGDLSSAARERTERAYRNARKAVLEQERFLAIKLSVFEKVLGYSVQG